MKTSVELKSDFRRGAKIVEVIGKFPNYELKELDRAHECTWVGDADDTHEYQFDDADPRPLFICHHWGVSAHSYNSGAFPLTAGAQRLLETPVDVKGWDLLDKGRFPSFKVKSLNWREYIIAVVEGTAEARSPEQKREHFAKVKSLSIKAWDKAGLNGKAIWDSKIDWSRENEVIELASQLIGMRFPGHMNSHRLFEKIAGYRSPLSLPRTLSAIRMAELSVTIVGKKRVPSPTRNWLTLS